MIFYFAALVGLLIACALPYKDLDFLHGPQTNSTDTDS